MTKFDETAFDGEKAQDAQPQTISNSEIAAILSVPAVYASKFYLANHDGSAVRLTFADETPDKKNIVARGSIIMTMNSFMALTQMLYNTANNIQMQLRQSEHFRQMMAENSKPKVEREELQ